MPSDRYKRLANCAALVTPNRCANHRGRCAAWGLSSGGLPDEADSATPAVLGGRWHSRHALGLGGPAFVKLGRWRRPGRLTSRRLRHAAPGFGGRQRRQPASLDSTVRPHLTPRGCGLILTCFFHGAGAALLPLAAIQKGYLVSGSADFLCCCCIWCWRTATPQDGDTTELVRRLCFELHWDWGRKYRLPRGSGHLRPGRRWSRRPWRGTFAGPAPHRSAWTASETAAKA